MSGQLIFRDRPFAFCGAEFHARHQPAEVWIAGASFGEEWIADAGCRSDFGSDVSLNPGFLCREMEARRAVDAVAIEEGHGGHSVFRAGAGEFFGQGSAIEEAERGAGMEF